MTFNEQLKYYPFIRLLIHVYFNVIKLIYALKNNICTFQYKTLNFVCYIYHAL